MAQSDLTIQNQSFPSFRADLNDALTALNSMQSGTSRPASAVAGTMWLDTTNATNPVIKFFDGTDDITFATVDYSANTINFSDSATDLLGDTTPQLGGMLDVNGQAIGDGTLELIKFLETASAVNEITITNADTTNAPEISATGDDTNIDLKLTPKGSGNLVLDGIKFPNADGTINQVLATNGSGVLSFANISGGTSWQSVPRFADFTAVAGEGYFCDTLGLERTVYVQSVGGSNKFFIGGVQQPTLELVEGNTYVFNYPSAHPFAFSETSDGTHGGGVEYTTGVTRDGVNYTLTYVVPASAPTLYYYCSTHSGMGGQANTPATQPSFTVTLPATPSAGDQVQIVDYAGTFDTNALIINPNGEDIEGGTSNLQLTGEREGVILTYIDSTQGWIATSGINEGTDALEPTPYSVDFLVIAGGGAGGGSYQAGGGGAGGYRTSTQTVNSGTVITVTVGDGGTGVATSDGNSGSNSSISGSGLTTITSAGGGGGRNINNSDSNGISGGSGGGVSFGTNPSRPILGGIGNTPNTSPSQGNDGGTITDAYGGSPWVGSGGGGAGATGGTGGISPNLGNGGNGTASSITGSSVTYAGGGGGSAFAPNPSGSNGGTGGGGDGDENNSANGSAGTVNTGGGGGASREGSGVAGYSGGKGVVILSVPTARYSSTTTGSPTVTTSGSNTIMQFNGSGSYTA